MYSIGDTVKYETQGIFRITGTKDMSMGGETRPFYILKPIFSTGSTIYLPVNEKTGERLHRLLSAKEIDALIKEIPNEETIWIEDKNERSETYKNILSGKDRSALIRMIKTLYLHGKKLKDEGRKLHVADERFLKDGERILYDEFACVLDIKQEDVLPIILDQIRVNERAVD